MHMDHYQEKAETSAIYPGKGTGSASALAYVTLGLAGEAGEIANKVKKIMRDRGGDVSGDVQDDLANELGDVLWYVAMLATELGFDLSLIAARNLGKLSARAARGTLQGSGDNR